LCTTLLNKHLGVEWSQIDAIVACEAGGFIFASALAVMVNKRLALVRKRGRLPPPRFSVNKTDSFISSVPTGDPGNDCFEVEANLLTKDSKVVVIDDVLSSGRTLQALFSLLIEAGVDQEHIRAMVVAEFPEHGGRKFLLDQGLEGVLVQSLLVFDGE
jgi:adenine/guanine phosphoribosyltransferase-like PRPP-binding protein